MTTGDLPSVDYYVVSSLLIQTFILFLIRFSNLVMLTLLHFLMYFSVALRFKQSWA